MININLHPWRQEQREEKKKEFFNFIALNAMDFVLLALFAQQILSTKISSQNFRNKYLIDQKEIYHKDIDLIIVKLNTGEISPAAFNFILFEGNLIEVYYSNKFY